MTAGQLRASRLRAEARRVKVSEMYFRLGMRQQEIAEQLGVSQATVSGDIKILIARWREVCVGDVDEARSKELADLAEMERDCALQFQSTKDPRWIAERRLIKKRRAELLGLDAPTRLAGPDGGPIQIQAISVDLTTLSPFELKLLEKIMENSHEAEDTIPQLKP